MANKMTKKEFFEIADKACLCVESLEDVLSTIECDTWQKARHYEEEGDNDYAELLKRRAHILHAELKKRGYYKK